VAGVWLDVLLALLIKADYAEGGWVQRGPDWLLAMRQDDGGWIVPAQQAPPRERMAAFWLGDPVPPERTRPHAHLATGMVLRAFASHPAYRQRSEVIRPGKALKYRFFQADKYNDRKVKFYWLKFQFPFWWPALLTGLDAPSRLGFDGCDADIARGLDWFTTNQAADGLWSTGYDSRSKAQQTAAAWLWPSAAFWPASTQIHS